MIWRPILCVLAMAFSAVGAAAAGETAGPVSSEMASAGYYDCVTHSCQLVPEVKQIKKTVYEVQEVPYCLKKLPPLWSLLHPHGCDCEACAKCQCVRYRKVLVKKEIVCQEICTTKCVPQAHVERVPCAPACK